ncbi:lysophospholipid acyltransferase family protein [Gilvimarinus polysaccharolyticus]|uniref:lysophospholipid acyltransferase family protein n=1 Tax=Gilvimarinus polysaccharolyticus TaxID=863921 RepID=UPI0018DD63AB|nr:lysophospholipid acyltransferase family protein [Gilvimarinus polysaccharolyticus]
MYNWVKYRADRLWRVAATGFCFSVFSLGGLLQSLLVFPIIYALPGNREHKAHRIRALQQRTFAGFVWLMDVLGVVRAKLHNTELLAKSPGCIVIANHLTLVDVVILFAHLPQANCVVKGELWRNRYLKGVMRAAGFISNESAEHLLRGCQKALNANEAVLIFPEGSRNLPGQGLCFKRGFANVAVRTGAPILTAFITCNPLTLTKGEPWYRIPPKCAEVNVYFAEVLQPATLIDDFEDKPRAARLLTSYLENYFEEGLKRYG